MEFSGEVIRFPGEGGWFYVLLPAEATDGLPAERGFIPVELAVGDTRWQSSLMPLGNGQHFVALPAKVRYAEGIQLGDHVTGTFEVRP
jgi:hypothetical protein